MRIGWFGSRAGARGMRISDGGAAGRVGRVDGVAVVGECEGAMSGVVDGLLAAADGVTEDAVEVEVLGLALASDRAPVEVASVD